MTRKDYIGFGIFNLFIACIPFLILNEYYLGTLVFAAVNTLAAIGLCLVMGYAGQISLGHAAFIGLGAYTSGILTVKLGLSPWPALAAGIGISVIIAYFVGVPSLRLKGHYLAMATLGFASIVHIVMVAATELTGGPQGINGIPYISLFGFEMDSDVKFYYFSWAVVSLGLFLALNLIHSRVGRALRAIHGSEDAAQSTGINTSTYKIQVFILSAAYASVAGSLYASYVNYIDPGPFGVGHSILLVTMVAVGGMHNIWGAITGAVILSLLPEFLSFTTEYLNAFGIEYKPDYDTLIYGGILLFIMLFMPEGLFHGVASLFSSVKRKSA